MSFLFDKLSKITAVASQSLALTKWYVDTLLQDGTVLFVQVGQISLGSVRLARVVADWFGADGQHVCGSADAIGVEPAVHGLSCHAARIVGDRVTFQTDKIHGELQMKPRHPGMALREPFLEHEGRQIRWEVQVPDADVTGTVRVQGAHRVVEGRGYRDRVQLEFTPWGLPLRLLRWGRAAAGPHAATWVEATTPREVIACSWKDGVVGARVGNEICEGSRTLFAGAVVDIDNLRLGPIAPVVRKLTRDPYEEKRVGRAVLDGCEGFGIQDLVRFRA